MREKYQAEQLLTDGPQGGQGGVRGPAPHDELDTGDMDLRRTLKVCGKYVNSFGAPCGRAHILETDAI